jgi:hypothetical protein
LTWTGYRCKLEKSLTNSPASFFFLEGQSPAQYNDLVRSWCGLYSILSARKNLARQPDFFEKPTLHRQDHKAVALK